MMRAHRDTSETTAVIPIQTLRELASGPHIASPHTENHMPTTDNWTLENVHNDPAKNRQMFDLRLERRKLGAAVKVERVENGYRVTIIFSGTRPSYERAEAARLYALVMDTVGDMLSGASDEPLQVDPDVLLTGSTVELEGQDAFLITCQHFGGDYDAGNAADAMMGTVI